MVHEKSKFRACISLIPVALVSFIIGCSLTSMDYAFLSIVHAKMTWARWMYHVIFTLIGLNGWWAYYRTSFTHAGRIPKEFAEISDEFRVWPPCYDIRAQEWLPGIPTLCKHCKIVRPERAHHCRWCDTCVTRWDHHCPLVGNCIGYGNHRYFIQFLLCCDLACILLVAYINIDIVYCLIGDWKSIRTRWDMEPNDLPSNVTNLGIWVGVGGILALTFAISLSVLGGMHLWFSTTNYTTLEWGFDQPNPYTRIGKRKNMTQFLGVKPGIEWFVPIAARKHRIDQSTWDGTIYPEIKYDEHNKPIKEPENFGEGNGAFQDLETGLPVPNEYADSRQVDTDDEEQAPICPAARSHSRRKSFSDPKSNILARSSRKFYQKSQICQKFQTNLIKIHVITAQNLVQ